MQPHATNVAEPQMWPAAFVAACGHNAATFVAEPQATKILLLVACRRPQILYFMRSCEEYCKVVVLSTLINDISEF